MKKTFSLGLILLSLLTGLLFLACQSVPNDDRLGDWADLTLRASGYGRIEKEWTIAGRVQAIQKAKVDSYTQLESQIMALRVDSRKTVLDLAEKDETIQTKIMAFVRGAKIVHTKNMDRGVRIDAELYLGENFKATIGLAEKKQSPVSTNPQRNRTLSR